MPNAEAHAELTAWRARIVATADETRRRIERDLHDGAQQHLVSLALRRRGSGLIGLKDRVEATGGTLGVESHPGQGTSLLVELPID